MEISWWIIVLAGLGGGILIGLPLSLIIIGLKDFIVSQIKKRQKRTEK